MNVKLITRKAYMSLILLILTASIAYSGYYISNLLNINKQSSLTNVDNVEWNSIKIMIDEEYDEAHLNVSNVSDKIKNDILNTYGNNKSDLLNDLKNPTTNSKLSTILNADIKGKYLNTNSNSDGLFVLSPTKGILADLSLTTSTTGILRTIDTEITLHGNKTLTKQALYSITSQSSEKYIFWGQSFTPKSYASINILKYMNFNGLKSVYYKYGLDGLANFEFLAPYYINQYDDILGQADIGGLGMKQANNKIIVVQEFNILDDINVNHPDFKLFYEDMRSEISSTHNIEETVVVLITILLCAVCLSFFMAMIHELNKIL